MYNKIKKIIIAITMVFTLIGCNGVSHKVKVAVIVKSTTSQFFKAVFSGANAASKEYNLELTFDGPENEEDYLTQIKMMEKAIRDKVDVIVLSAIDYRKLVKSVEDAVEAGIQVVVIDSDVDSKKVHTRISTNNYEAGKMAGDTVLTIKENELHVGIVNFDVNTANGQEREHGLRKVLNNDERVLSIEAINVQSDIDSSTQAAKDILLQHPDINVIVTFNEWTTLGVGYAIEQLGYKDRVSMIGFDNNPISIEMLEDGVVDALIVQNPFAIGYLGVEEAYRLSRGQNSKETIYTKTVVITKENMFQEGNQKIVFPFD